MKYLLTAFLLLASFSLSHAQLLFTAMNVGGAGDENSVTVVNGTTNAIYWTGSWTADGHWTYNGSDYHIPNNISSGTGGGSLLLAGQSQLLDDYTFGAGAVAASYTFTGSFGGVTAGSPVADQSITISSPGLWQIFIAGTLPPVYTNFTICIQNNLGVTGYATWTFNGVLVKAETLVAGASDCWTTPRIEVSPVAEPASAQTDIVTLNSMLSFNTNGQPNFGSQDGGGQSFGIGGGSLTNTVNGGGTSSTSGPTNTYTAPPVPPITPSTNTVVWSPSGGGATESTLEGVGSLLHGDLNSVISGESILHNDLNAANNNLVMLTNELGQLVTFQIHRTNNDDLGQLIPIFTNLVNALSNRPPDTVSSFPTNFSLSISNFATEGTLVGISNLLGAADTNGQSWTNVGVAYLGETNYDQAVADSVVAGDTLEADIIAFTSDMVGPTITPGAISDSDWTIHLDFGVAKQDVDLSPSQFPNVMACFAWCRQFEEFLFGFWFLLMVCADFWKAIEMCNESHGVQPSVNPTSGSRTKEA